MKEVGELVRGVGARRVVPIHTENPGRFREFMKGQGWGLELPRKGVPLSLRS